MEQVFELIISSCENNTWQGTLRTKSGEISFCSELELLLELARLVPPKGVGELLRDPRQGTAVRPGKRKHKSACETISGKSL